MGSRPPTSTSRRSRALNRVDDALSTPDQHELHQRAERKIASAAEESELRRPADANAPAILLGVFAALDIDVTFVGGAS